MYLLDTMVLSETLKSRSDPTVVRWLEAHKTAAVSISVVSIGEIARGIAKLETLDPPRAAKFESWLQEILDAYRGRIHLLTVPVMRVWGPLSHKMRNTNPDLLIAATVLEHDLTLVTRNTRHFEPTGVRLINPYA